MKVSLNIRVSDSDIEEHIRRTGMTHKTIVKFIRSEALKAAEHIIQTVIQRYPVDWILSRGKEDKSIYYSLLYADQDNKYKTMFIPGGE